MPSTLYLAIGDGSLGLYFPGQILAVCSTVISNSLLNWPFCSCRLAHADAIAWYKMKIALTVMALVGMMFTGAASANSFVVGVEEIDYYPLHSYANGKFSGYGRELLDAFAKQYGHSFTYTPFPVSRLFHTFLNENSIDFKYPDNPNWQADLKKGKSIFYSDPVINVSEGLLVKPEKVEQLSETSLQTIVTMRGFTPWPIDQTMRKKINNGTIRVYQEDSFNKVISLGMTGHYDAVYASPIVINYYLDVIIHQPGALVFDKKLPFESNDFSLSSIRQGEVIKQFNEFLEKNQPLVMELKKKYRLTDKTAQ
ncbi:ABC transporter substrate-binding protein [Chromobacterium sp. IIBBL 290-4]|uniref:substrate-binding periplasmic protein n=1 Tax=Chromobacterium sp. IIBBL 290-4 TaxID=2953890 RepID=UPI0020B84E17|nr:transporter substrate-binding domain-containing protein [Chromobacterium sp. IIBBL 290-4]UTH72758.1 transporter substrate-binding domain-containing protein [Chromobacterium sp. IIBBL 290-4]